MPQPSKVLGADGGASLDLNAHNAAVGGLEYGIHLYLVLGPVVEEVSALLIPAELARQFRKDEVLDHRTSGTVRFTKPSAVLPEQVAGEATVHVGQLRGTDRALGVAAGPGRDLLDEEDSGQQFQVSIHGRSGDAGLC